MSSICIHRLLTFAALFRVESAQAASQQRYHALGTLARLDTKGGKAPANACASSHAAAELRVPYTAEYYFYGNIK
jgi:hypothetical protein